MLKRREIIYIFLTALFVSCGDNQKSIDRAKEEEIVIKPAPTTKVIKKVKYRDYSFLLKSVDESVISIKTNNNYYGFSPVREPIVLINFFSTWCPPCIGQLPHLNNIQKRYKDKLSILGILLYDEELKDEELKKFIELQKINFFISNNMRSNKRLADFIAPKLQLDINFSIPIMVFFLKGRYYTHYEGAIPEEMIESDIKQALDKLGI